MTSTKQHAIPARSSTRSRKAPVACHHRDSRWIKHTLPGENDKGQLRDDDQLGLSIFGDCNLSAFLALSDAFELAGGLVAHALSVAKGQGDATPHGQKKKEPGNSRLDIDS